MVVLVEDLAEEQELIVVTLEVVLEEVTQVVEHHIMEMAILVEVEDHMSLLLKIVHWS